MTKDYCVKCKAPMAKIDLGGKLKQCFVCVDKNCRRFGLLAVVGYKLAKKIDKEVNKKDAKLSTNGSKKRNRKKG